MGDGGVACMPLQQHTNINIMERFPDKTTATTAHCNNNTNTSTSSGGNKSTAAAATSLKNDSNGISGASKCNENKNGAAAAAATSNGTGLKTKKVVKRIVKVKKVVTVKKPVQDKSGAGAEKGRKGIENGLSSVACKVQGNKEEVEEGELGTLKSPPRVEAENGEPALQEKPRRSEIEKGDANGEKWRKGDAERGEATTGKFLRKGEIARDSRDDIEKGEFVPDRWQSKGGEYVYGKLRGRYEMSRDCTPPSGKYFNEDSFRRKDFSRSGSIQLSKSSMRWEGGHDRNSGRISSKIVDEEGSYKSEYSNGKNHGREHPLGNRLKRVGIDSGGIERKHFGDYGDYMSSKSRRLGEDGSRPLPLENYSRHSGEKFYKGSGSSSSRISSLDKYSSRHNEPTLSSKLVYDRHGRSPGHSERSPFDKARYYDHRDRSPLPVRRERSPYGRERSPYGGERTPYGRERSPYGGERIPYGRERSPYGRERSPYGHGKSPVGREKSPHDRGRNYEHRRRSPVYSERSPQDRARHHHSRRDRTPSYVERSPLDRSRPDGHREASRKSGANEKRNSQKVDKRQEDKIIHRDSSGEDVQAPDKESQSKGSALDPVGADEKDAICESHNGEQSQIPVVDVKESPRVDGPPPEELLSMEEDMDICDTPPHIPVVPESSMGKWYYLDYSGVEQGPSRLFDLKTLVDDGVLVLDHFIKHIESDRWVTIENAVSPLTTLNFPSIVPEALTQLVSPPEAPGNLLAVADTGDIGQTSIKNSEEMPTTSSQPQANLCDSAAASEPLQDLLIDARVGALLEGFPVIPGKELDTIGEALQMAFEHVPTEEWEKLEGFTWHQTCSASHQDGDELSRWSDLKAKEDVEEQLSAPFDPDQGFNCSFDVADWFSGPWSCKGGDWKRQDDAVQDRLARRKLVLNDGFPLCQMPKAGSEDPRWHRKDDLYCPSQSRRLDLPLWACYCSDEKNEAVGKLTITKPPVARGLKGTALPVVRINACVVKDHGSFISESRTKVRGKDRYSSRSSRMFCATSDVKRPSIEGDFLCKAIDDQESNCSWKSNVSINIPKDRLCTVHDLQLHLGDWYYLDGAGHEQGPRSISELQVLVDQGFIQKYSSIFRKSDRLWIPVPSGAETSEPRLKVDNAACLNDLSNIFSQSVYNDQTSSKSSFNSLHPQFIGYTRGKLHELVMKAYKSREFAAAINEVLDPWISAKLPKKENEEHMYWKSDIDGRSSKRARMLDDECGEGYELEEDMGLVQKDETPFEELCGDAAFIRDETACSGTEMGSWGLLDGWMLARVFHFLRFDLKSLAFASLTCKHWRAAVGFYKDISRQVDFSSIGPDCTDSMIWNIMNGYNRQRINSMVLIRCTNITSGMLEQIVCAFPYLSSIDVRGCIQFAELACQFPNLSWVKSRNSRGARISEESHSRMKSLKQISEIAGVINDFSVEEYIESGNKRDSANQLFRRSLYKRSKLFDARKSSSILSRDARLRRWAMKKSEYDYKRMEGFLASGLKDIMKKNNIEIFVPKVAEIEDKMKNGYYRSHGLRSVKEDIRRMCRDAEKARIRGGGEISHISGLFYKLASLLEKSLKFSYERDELMKSWKDDLSGSSSMKYKKKSIAERRLSRSNRKSTDSGSDTSDDFDKSFAWGDSESTASDTESDLDFRPEGRTGESRGDGYYTADDSSYSVADEREWGARMTKESLVPPVTRKYEVIDRYVIVADEEDVQRKMCVSLPDDYADKLDAQKNGTEELDMELPEVKDYRPRKKLGDEVIEQEVYGIDPYTHNLLLDSMPDELEWTLLEKHLFIEDVLLRTLNKQVRHFTGTGNTPMMHPLQLVIQEIEKAAEANCDIRTTKMCRGILKAMDNRRDDQYVAYRKGLGVVCNKEGGFGEEDFVVEFLGEVYPAWKWFEKQDGIRSLQKDSEDPAPEFYNIYLERPKGDADGYDLVVVDAMHKANYASRICHSCRPNCEAKVTAVAGQYQIGIYTVREIQFGEEITFDYNSVTESKEEYEASVCLCGSQVCRGSYLNLTGEGAFQKVLKERHGMLDRHHLMIEACQLNCVSEEDYVDLGKAGLGSCLLGGLPDWVVAYSARLVRFINLERTKLPTEILRHNLEEKRKYSLDISMEVERSDAEVQAEGVYNQRLQNLAVTLDKVRYVMRCVFGDPKRAPPPLEKLSPVETVSFLWKGEGSLVEELLQCMAPHMEKDMLNGLKSKIQAHDPSDSDDISRALRKSLLWLRDELQSLPCTYKCRHDAAADLIHIYAYTKFFFRVRKYKTFTSPPVYISPLDLGPKYTDKLGSGNHEYRKTYGENYCMGQLIFWHIQTNAEPDCSLDRAIRGCLSLPNVASFYTKVQKPSQHRVYSPKMLKDMLERMEKYPQKPWPKDLIWSFKNFPDVFGSPMLDCVLTDSPLDKEMINWLKQRPTMFQAMWDTVY